MRNGLLLIFFIILLTTELLADEFVVQSFRIVSNDLSARTNPKKDVNDEFCALIKISTDLSGLKFYSNQLENVDKKQYEYWLYVSPGTKYLEISKQGFIKLPYEIPARLEPSTVYRMVLTNKDKAGISAIENTVQLAFRFNVNDVFVSYNNLAPIRTRGTGTSIKLPPGEYDFKFTKEGYRDKTQTINLQEDKIVNIDLEEGQSQTRMVFGGMVTINSNPNGADVYINGQMVGQTPYVNELLPGQYNLTLQKKFYHENSTIFTLEEEQSLTVPTIDLNPKFAYIAIETTPAKANIYLDNKRLGNSPIGRQQVESGNHTIRIEKDLYHTQEYTISLEDGDDETLTYDLQPAFGTLVINSDPTGADVYIDGNKAGTTPYRNETQPSGQYTVRVTKDKWYPAEEILEVKDGETTNKILMLSQNFGTINITAAGADIFVNNRKVGRGTYKEQLQPGRYTLKATQDRHYDATKEIFLRIGDNQNITLKPEPKMASLSIISQPADKTMGSRIFVNNEVVPDKTTPAVLPLLIGDYDITLKHRNFLDMTKQVSLKEGEREKLTFNMQTYSGSMLQKENKWKRNKRLSFMASVLIAGAGVYCNMQGDNYYEDFQAATTTDAADAAWDDCNNMYQYRDISYSVSIAPVVFGLYSWIRQAHFRNARSNR